MLSQFTAGLLKSSLKHFLDIEPVICDCLLSQTAARLFFAREAVISGLTGITSRIDQFEQSIPSFLAATGTAFRIGTAS